MHTSLAAGPLRSAMLGRGIRFPCCIAASAPLTTTTISPPTKHIEFPRSVANLSTKCSTFSKKPLTHSSVREKHPLIEKTSATSQSAQSIITSSLRRNFSNSANLQASPSTSPSEVPLDWNTFFKLRASRRRYSLISSVLASITSTAAGVQILSAQDLDALGAQVMGLDPFIVLGLATAGFGAMGWLIGPILGNTVWGLVHRQYRGGVAIKEKEFFNRIKRFRVDPSANSIANPVPDYYGEKIGSVQGYRQWLKDQRAYNRKKSRPLL